MCNCIKKYESDAQKYITKKYPESECIGFEFKRSVGVMLPSGKQQTYTAVDYTIRKKGSTSRGLTKKTFIPHEYCPFCGNPYMPPASNSKPIKK